MSASAVDHRALVREILSRDFALKVSLITSLGHGHRNLVFLVDLHEPARGFWARSHSRRSSKLGTVPIPKGTTRLVFRLFKPNDSLIRAARAENTVAAMNVAKLALSQNSLPRLVPHVYGWNSEEYEPNTLDWVLEEYIPGRNLARDFPSLPISKQRIILAQIADVVKAFQTHKLPDTITPFSGLAFGRQGRLRSGPLRFQRAGELSGSIASFYQGLMVWGFEESLRRGFIQSGSPLVNRLEHFFEHGADELLASLPKGRPTFIKGNLEPVKILYDPETLHITAILDYSFSHVAIPVVEFLYSFTAFSGLFPGPFDKSNKRLRYAMLYGFPELPPISRSMESGPLTFDSKRNIQWGLAKAWEGELNRAGVLRPRNTDGADLLSQLHSFIQNLAPSCLCDDDIIYSRDDEQALEALAHLEEILEKYLENWGY